MTLTDFLLARIAEDEMMWRNLHSLNSLAARLRAECEAKRRIIGRHFAREFFRPGGSDLLCEGCGGHSPCADVRTLAAVYADHPDYREDWRTGAL